MEIGQNAPADKPAPGQRDRLPNKRACETIAFERDGSHYQMTVGFYPGGRPGEVFLNADRGDSLLDVMTSDAAIAVSLALQYGAPLDGTPGRDTRPHLTRPINWLVQHDRCRPAAAAREAHLRSLMGLPSAPGTADQAPEKQPPRRAKKIKGKARK